MNKEKFKEILMDLLQNDEDIQYFVKEALSNQDRRDSWAEARAWSI